MKRWMLLLGIVLMACESEKSLTDYDYVDYFGNIVLEGGSYEYDSLGTRVYYSIFEDSIIYRDSIKWNRPIEWYKNDTTSFFIARDYLYFLSPSQVVEEIDYSVLDTVGYKGYKPGRLLNTEGLSKKEPLYVGQEDIYLDELNSVEISLYKDGTIKSWEVVDIYFSDVEMLVNDLRNRFFLPEIKIDTSESDMGYAKGEHYYSRLENAEHAFVIQGFKIISSDVPLSFRSLNKWSLSYENNIISNIQRAREYRKSSFFD